MKIHQGILLHPGAAQDVTEIWNFIASDDSWAADRFREKSFDAVLKLVTFPNQGRRRLDLTTRPLHFINVREYLIAYAPEEQPLVVIAVRHGRRNPDSLAAILRQRQ